MPLIDGCSKDSADENYSKLLSEGRDSDEAFAITADVAEQNKDKCDLERQMEIEEGEIF